MASEVSTRRLPRFSLRSLMLFVLLAGSGYGLWARWEPWVLVREVLDEIPTERQPFSPDGARILTIRAEDKMVSVRSVETGNIFHSFETDEGYRASFATFSPQGRYVLASTGSGVIQWDAKTGKYLRTLVPLQSEHMMYVGFLTPPAKVWFEAGNKYVVTYVSPPTDLSKFKPTPINWRLFDLESGEIVCKYTLPQGRDFPAVSPDGRFLARRGENQDVRIEEIASQRLLRRFAVQNLNHGMMEFYPDSRRLLLTAGQRARVWDTVTGKRTMVMESDDVGLAWLSSNGRYVLTNRRVVGWVDVHDSMTGRQIGHLTGAMKAMNQANSRVLIHSIMDDDLTVWDLASCGKLSRMPFNPDPHSFYQSSDYDPRFSPNGQILALNVTGMEKSYLYRRRRPEYWWGVAWLPELWLTVVLGLGLVFSLWRDSRIMRA